MCKALHPQVLQVELSVIAAIFSSFISSRSTKSSEPNCHKRMLRGKSVHEQQLDSLSTLKNKLEPIDGSKLIFSDCCIYKVPPKLRKVNEEAYTPSMVSIGPYHHGDERLKSMEEAKLWFLNKFLKRNEEKQLEDYVKAIKELEREIRRCYSETILMESDEFISMILIDACFIIEYFLTNLGSAENNPWHDKQWPNTDIRQDLILSENQLPFFVLEKLLDLTFPGGLGGHFVEIAFAYVVACFLPGIFPASKLGDNFDFRDFQQSHLRQPQNGTVQVYHLCDMLRMCYSPNDLPPRGESVGGKKLKYSASKLHEAGIVFQANEDKSVVEVQYLKGVLKIPVIKVFDSTETLMRNMVAFEQCHLPRDCYMSNYACFLDYLIDTGKDVEMLVEKGIIYNSLGDSNAVASMVNNLDKEVIQATISGDYISLYEELNTFYENPYHKHMAIFKHEYLSTPWKIASFFAAILLLSLTFIQTVCSVISLFNK